MGWRSVGLRSPTDHRPPRAYGVQWACSRPFEEERLQALQACVGSLSWFSPYDCFGFWVFADRMSMSRNGCEFGLLTYPLPFAFTSSSAKRLPAKGSSLHSRYEGSCTDGHTSVSLPSHQQPKSRVPGEEAREEAKDCFHNPYTKRRRARGTALNAPNSPCYSPLPLGKESRSYMKLSMTRPSTTTDKSCIHPVLVFVKYFCLFYLRYRHTSLFYNVVCIYNLPYSCHDCVTLYKKLSTKA